MPCFFCFSIIHWSCTLRTVRHCTVYGYIIYIIIRIIRDLLSLCFTLFYAQPGAILRNPVDGRLYRVWSLGSGCVCFQVLCFNIYTSSLGYNTVNCHHAIPYCKANSSLGKHMLYRINIVHIIISIHPFTKSLRHFRTRIPRRSSNRS